MSEVTTTIAVAFVSALLGFGGGFVVKGKFTDAAKVAQVTKAQVQTATNIVQATKESQAVDANIAASNAAVDADKQAAHERVVTQIRYVYKEKEGEKITQECGPAYIDAGTIRLLNAARAGIALGSTSVSNDQGGTPEAASNP